MERVAPVEVVKLGPEASLPLGCQTIRSPTREAAAAAVVAAAALIIVSTTAPTIGIEAMIAIAGMIVNA